MTETPLHDGADADALADVLRVLFDPRHLRPDLRRRVRKLRPEAERQARAIAERYRARSASIANLAMVEDARRLAADLHRVLLRLVKPSPESRLLLALLADVDPADLDRSAPLRRITVSVAHAAGLASRAEKIIDERARGAGALANRIFGSAEFRLVEAAHDLAARYWHDVPAGSDGRGANLAMLAAELRALAGNHSDATLRGRAAQVARRKRTPRPT